MGLKNDYLCAKSLFVVIFVHGGRRAGSLNVDFDHFIIIYETRAVELNPRTSVDDGIKPDSDCVVDPRTSEMLRRVVARTRINRIPGLPRVSRNTESLNFICDAWCLI